MGFVNMHLVGDAGHHARLGRFIAVNADQVNIGGAAQQGRFVQQRAGQVDADEAAILAGKQFRPVSG